MSDTTTLQTTNTLSSADVPSAPPEAHQRAAAEGAGNTDSIYSGMSATYSPEDNKLRLRSAARLSPDLYARLKRHGFSWAPRQEVFVASMWSPGREDLLLELCGEIGDEDCTLIERAEERAERFEGYSERRSADAAAAHAAVQAIAGRFEMGQPILVGHHSERRARKDKERMDDGMRKAVRMWDTSQYWAQRAQAAKAHAEYKQLPAVRHRRIKTLQAELRKQQRRHEQATDLLALWQAEGLDLARALRLAAADYITIQRDGISYPESIYSLLESGALTVSDALGIVVKRYTTNLSWYGRWISHYSNRIAYESAMLEEAGGLKADAFDIQVGGRVLVRNEWLAVLRVTRKDGAIVSVSTNCRYVRVKSIEQIKDYRPPSEEDADAVKAATTLPPMCNYPGEDFHHMTKAEWDATHKDYKGSRRAGQGAMTRPDLRRPEIKDSGAGLHRVRVVVRRGSLVPVFLTDAKRKDPPPAAPDAPAAPKPLEIEKEAREARPAHQPVPPTEFDAMRQQLRNGGAQVVIAPQLFPTPAPLAEMVARLARLAPGARVLEPSAGTGSLVHAALQILNEAGGSASAFHAIEIDRALAGRLQERHSQLTVRCADFLELVPEEFEAFDSVLMNPPFLNAQDIKHIEHARRFLKPGGRLVAICANGPRQQAALRHVAVGTGGFYRPLPEGSFASSGTQVATALVVING